MPHLRMKIDGHVIGLDDCTNNNYEDQSTYEIHLKIIKNGRESMMDVVKTLSSPEMAITPTIIEQQLRSSHNVNEYDLLVQCSHCHCLCAFPPWSLRVTEIVPYDHTKGDRMNEKEFLNILHTFAKRDQRFGK
jgi:undecaprenyl pyrophosphate synthase